MDSARAPVPIDQLLAHADWVRGLARALTADEASADDVAQETWLAALERPPKSADQPKHWLAVVTRNVARRLIRKRRSDAALERAAAQDEGLLSTDDIVVRAALQQRVVAAVMRLDEPYRSTLLQRFFDRMAPRAIAAAAQIPVETVKTRLKRGLELIRRDLAGEFEREGTSWPAALVMLKRLAQPAAPATAAGAIGVLLMTKTAKLAIAAAVVAVAAPTSWWLVHGERRGRPIDSAPTVSAPAPAVASPSVAKAAEVVRSEEAKSDAPPDAAAAAVDPAAKGTIRGRVVDLQGRPVAKAFVCAGDEGDGAFKDHDTFFDAINGVIQSSSPPIDAARATTSADGTFELAGLDRRKTWSVGAGDPVAGCAFRSPLRFEGTDLDRSIELRCEGGVSFAGTCTDPDGAPLRLGFVMISVKRDDPSLRTNRYADFVLQPHIDDDGTVRTMAVPCHWFTVQASIFPPSKPGTLEPGEGGYKEIRIPWTRIPDDQHEWRLELKFERAVGLSGRIVAQDGAPAGLASRLQPQLIDAEIERQSRETLAVVALTGDPRRDANVLRSVSSWSGGFMTGADYGYGTLDLAHDRYTIDRPPPTARFVALLARNELLGAAEIPAGGAGPDLPIDLARLPEEPLVRLVRFTATNALDGKPLDQVQIDLVCRPAHPLAGQSTQMLNEPDERRANPPVVHELSLPIGTAVIRTYRYDFAGDYLTAEIPPGEEPLELTLALQPAGKAAIRGEVVDSDGRPVARALLRLYRKADLKPVSNQRQRMPGASDSSGRFEVHDLPAADYLLAAQAPLTTALEKSLAPAVLTVAAREQPELCRLVLPPGIECELDVSFSDGVGRGVQLRALDGEGLPLIDDADVGFDQFWRNCGRMILVLPKAKTTLEFRGNGAGNDVKSFPFEPSRSSTASFILPAR